MGYTGDLAVHLWLYMLYEEKHIIRRTLNMIFGCENDPTMATSIVTMMISNAGGTLCPNKPNTQTLGMDRATVIQTVESPAL